jgi:hypothetical protein
MPLIPLAHGSPVELERFRPATVVPFVNSLHALVVTQALLLKIEDDPRGGRLESEL